MHSIARTIGWASCALAVQTAVVHAQVLRGIVRDSAAAVPLSGAVVVTLDAKGDSIARTLTDSAGRFALTSAIAERADRLRVIRIGYVPREIRIARTETRAINVALSRIPALLTGVNVAERQVCPGRSDVGGTTAWRLWEQARAGLLASVVASSSNPVNATTLLYQRRTAAYDGLVRRQRIDTRTGFATRPFSAAAPARFVERGYLDEDSTGRTFHGLDADVLLDPSFVTTHCFGVEMADVSSTRQPARAGTSRRIGVTFAPTTDRDTVVDVTGVIWFLVDTTGVALSELEFKYTALEPAAVRAEVGGNIGFRTLSNGVTFVERWTLRLPVLSANAGAETNTLAPAGPGRTRRMADRRARVNEIEEAGGVLTEASWRDGVTWRAPLTGLTGTVLESGSQSPVPGAVVSIVGGSSTVADLGGEFMFAPLIPGRYAIEIADTTLSKFADPRRTTQEIEVRRDQLMRITARVPAVADVVAEACKERRPGITIVGGSPHRLVAGRLIVSTEDPAFALKGARIRASFLSSDSTRRGASASISIDDRGSFIICAPSSAPGVALRLATQSLEADTTVDVASTVVTPLDWRPTLRLAAAGSETRMIRGVVTDSANRPIPRVNVTAFELGTTTDDSGGFRLRLPTHNAAVIELRRLGFAPARFGFRAGDDTTIAVTMLPNVQQLEALEVKANAPTSAKLRGFEERLARRARGITFGTFITADQIEQRSPAQITQMFFEIPYIKVIKVHPTFERYALFGFSRTITNGPSACPATVFIDGVRALEGGDVIGKDPNTGRPMREQGVAVNDLVSPASIAGIEVYRNGLDAPPQFQATNGTCAVVLIWTK
jgi:hypothetical protein